MSTVEAIALALEALGEPNFFQPALAALEIAVKAEKVQGGVLSDDNSPNRIHVAPATAVRGDAAPAVAAFGQEDSLPDVANGIGAIAIA